MEKLWIPLKVNPSPDNIDVLFLLEDKTCVVGRKIERFIYPSNVHAEYHCGAVEFDCFPIAWQELPFIEGKVE